MFVGCDGSALRVRWTVAPLIRDGEWIGGIVSVRDLTAQKRSEEALGVMAGTIRSTGVAFLRQLVETLAHAIERTMRSVFDLFPVGIAPGPLPVVGRMGRWNR